MTHLRPPLPVQPARGGRAGLWVTAIAVVYLAALAYFDRDRNILSQLAELAVPLSACAALVLLSYVCRYQRWRRVLAAQGHPVHAWWQGLVAYLAGFAFTASPGKAGELLRIRYFSWQGIPAQATLTAFIFERAIDLLIITLLSIGAATLFPAFGMLVLIILVVLLALLALACWPPLARWARGLSARLPGTRVRRTADFLIDGGTALAPLLRTRLLLGSMGWGSAAWSLTAAAFAWLCHSSGISVPAPLLLGIYPMAMLIGALSFVPGGVGTTEAAIVLMLVACGIKADAALAIAIGIRLASLWLAVLVGMLAMAALESRALRAAARR
ncbi:lysylphosphatidylglycerol synthetase family protein [Stenotrophomonas sp. ESTM1D_MKCIP4_1]|uniref:lysylphosphatidylglycerol synthase transmembrane domain-containing protein n=1 Tax=Stenotrophomonas sp. ESTM1D_MKCIP4_1 TaxID=2072414 RepID=UPI000D5417CF|nr:lysylphosphatidylglycerol synthase transmembrane domain-containing protein [Stenotrophomonas sp. ESTM1D_MKCIP4_1]AWH52185.1 lysylphosphatidylglycerol synthetase family protein [Stenotrophomonas sp. ESTM1D_MKCIP4_1]